MVIVDRNRMNKKNAVKYILKNTSGLRDITCLQNPYNLDVYRICLDFNHGGYEIIILEQCSCNVFDFIVSELIKRNVVVGIKSSRFW